MMQLAWPGEAFTVDEGGTRRTLPLSVLEVGC